VNISVIIATHNQAERLRLVLCGLQQQTLNSSRFEVIVVDDGSVDDTQGVLAEKMAVNLRVITLATNQGRNVARNWGIRAAVGALVVFIDGDALPAPDLLACYWDAYERLGDRVVYSGMQYCLPQLEYLQDPQTGELMQVPMASIEKDYIAVHRDEWVITESMVRNDFPAIRARAQEGGYPFPELEKRQKQVRRLLAVVPTANCGWLGFIPHNGAVPSRLLTEAGGFDESISFSEGWELAYRLQRECGAVVRAVNAEVFHLYHYHDFADAEQGDMRFRAVEYMVDKFGDDRLRLLYCWWASLWPDPMLPDAARVRSVLELERRYNALTETEWRDYEILFARHPRLGKYVKKEVDYYATYV
jgi:glycosyltransferase involved in cell wall biosynthesis